MEMPLFPLRGQAALSRSAVTAAPPRRRVGTQPSLEPGADAGDQTHRAAVLFIKIACRIRSVLQYHAEIRCKFANDLVTQTQFDIHLATALADAGVGVSAGGDRGLAPRLQDQTLGDQPILLGLEPGRNRAALTNEGSRITLEPVGRAPVQTQHCVTARSGRDPHVTNTGLHVPILRQQRAVKQLHIRGPCAAVAGPAAFALQPEPAVIAAEPGARAPL